MVKRDKHSTYKRSEVPDDNSVKSGRSMDEIAAEADRTRHDPALWAWLDGPRAGQPEPAASEVHFPLLGLAAKELGRDIRWSLTESGAEIRF